MWIYITQITEQNITFFTQHRKSHKQLLWNWISLSLSFSLQRFECTVNRIPVCFTIIGFIELAITPKSCVDCDALYAPAREPPTNAYPALDVRRGREMYCSHTPFAVAFDDSAFISVYSSPHLLALRRDGGFPLQVDRTSNRILSCLSTFSNSLFFVFPPVFPPLRSTANEIQRTG